MRPKEEPFEEAKKAIAEKRPLEAYAILTPILTEMEQSGEQPTGEMLEMLAALTLLDGQKWGTKEG